MAWTKTKIAIVAGIAGLLGLGVATWIALQLDNPHRLALAMGRHAIANRTVELLDLSTFCDKPAENFKDEWSVVPTGFQTFCHVPFQI